MVKLFRQRKGQSAIEYLTTYGWMLLVIAIVGGAIFSTVQNSSQIQSTSGLANAEVQVANFGVTGNGLELELRAASQDQLENVNVTLYQENTDNVEYATNPDGGNLTIPVGDTDILRFPDIESSENTNTFEMQITYDIGELTGKEVNGTITNRMTDSTSN